MAVERSACCTGEKEQGQSEPGTVAGFEAGQRTAPSGCGTASPEPEAWGNGVARVQGSGQERRVTGWGAASLESEGLAWVLQACSGVEWSDLAFEADCRHLPPSLADWKAE